MMARLEAIWVSSRNDFCNSDIAKSINALSASRSSRRASLWVNVSFAMNNSFGLQHELDFTSFASRPTVCVMPFRGTGGRDQVTPFSWNQLQAKKNAQKRARRPYGRQSHHGSPGALPGGECILIPVLFRDAMLGGFLSHKT